MSERLARSEVRRVLTASDVRCSTSGRSDTAGECVYVEMLDADGGGVEADRGGWGGASREGVFVRVRRRRADGRVL